MRTIAIVRSIFLLVPAVAASAQTGALDQVSSFGGAGYNGDTAWLVWQQQVRAGIAGQLEGFTLQVTGNAGATLDVRLRAGPGWNTSAALFTGVVTKTANGTEDVFVDVTSAALTCAVGDTFVIEMQGTGTGLGINGSYVAPPGTPAYPELLFLGGPGCFADCGWRIGFRSYVLVSGAGVFCTGDGTGASCPCGNSSAPPSGEGCLSTLGTGGRLRAVGTASIGNDTLVLRGTQLSNAPALYLQGTSQLNGGAGATFGDGKRCAGGTIVPLGTKTGFAGASQYPGPGDPSVSLRGGVTAPGVRTYQTWYRNAASFCTPSTFNLTNGLEVTWTL